MIFPQHRRNRGKSIRHVALSLSGSSWCTCAPKAVISKVNSAVYTECGQKWPRDVCWIGLKPCSLSLSLYGHYRLPSNQEDAQQYMDCSPISKQFPKLIAIKAIVPKACDTASVVTTITFKYVITN